MSEAENTLDAIEACKEALIKTLDEHINFPKTGFLFSIADRNHAEDCLREVVNDLFYRYKREARHEAEQSEWAEQRQHERFESMGRI